LQRALYPISVLESKILQVFDRRQDAEKVKRRKAKGKRATDKLGRITG